MQQSIRLMIVNSQRLFRECLSSMLTKEGFTVVGQEFNQKDALTQVDATELDVVLIDINSLNDSALELTMRLSLKYPQARLVILGLDGEEENFLQFIEAGAIGYVLKEAGLVDLVAIIGMVFRGETVCSPQTAYSVFSRVAELSHEQLDRKTSGPQKLTMRELEILQLIADGLSNKQIAERLNKSLFTVKNHVHNILEKLHVHFRQEAIMCAYRNGILKRLEPAHLNPDNSYANR